MMIFPIKWQVLEVYDLPSQEEGADEPLAIGTDRKWAMHPAILGRIPLFLPSKRRKGLAEALNSRWGTVNLPDSTFNTLDEDLFITLINCGGVFRGSLKELLIKMSRAQGKDAVCSIAESIEVLSSSKLSLTCSYNGVSINFNDTLLTASGDTKYCELVINSAFVCNGKEEQRKLHCRNLDLNIRKGLSDTGKVIYRFLNCHSTKFTLSLDMVKETVSPFSRSNNFRQELVEQLRKLMDVHYLKTYTVDKGKLSYARV